MIRSIEKMLGHYLAHSLTGISRPWTFTVLRTQRLVSERESAGVLYPLKFEEISKRNEEPPFLSRRLTIAHTHTVNYKCSITSM